MAAEILRRRVDDDVGAELERALEEGRGERVVDDEDRARCVRRVRSRADVDHVQHGIRRRLDPDEARALVEVLAEIREVGRGQVVEDVALGLVHLRRHPVHAAVDVRDQNGTVARIDQVHDRRHGAEAGRERDAVLRRLQGCETGLERSARRVRDAGVVVALVFPDRVLDVRRGLVDRHRDGARGGIRLLAFVDRASLEVH